MLWPPQNTGVFAPASCVVCCRVPGVPVFEIAVKDGPGRCGYERGYLFYKTRTWSGSLHYEFFDSCGEGANSLGSGDTVLSGSAVKGLSDESNLYSCEELSNTLTDNGELSGEFPGNISGGSDNYILDLGTETEDVLQGNGNCACFGTGGEVCAVITGTVSQTWSNEDTLQDAIDRIDASPWSDWLPAAVEIAAIFGTLDPSDIIGDAHNYTAVKWRYKQSGLEPLTEYLVSVDVLRRAALSPGDPFVLYATQEETGTTDVNGDLEIADILVPNDVGFQTLLAETTVTCVKV